MDGEGRGPSGRRVVVGGAINTDLVGWTARSPRPGETVTGTGFAIFGGGKGANQAVAAARSAATVTIVGAVGDDTFGRDRLADLTAEGIATGAVQRFPDAASGVALITVEGGDNRILYVPGATLSVDASRAIAAVGDDPVGVLLVTLELERPVLDSLIARTRWDGGLVLLNATPEPERAAALLAAVDILIVNEREALALVDREPSNPDPAIMEDWSAVAAALRDQGATAVLITLGSSGALWLDADGSRTVPALAVNVVDTTGAGDTLCGALAAAVARGVPAFDAVRIGVVAGSLACTVAGAQPSIPTLAAIERSLSGPGHEPE